MIIRNGQIAMQKFNFRELNMKKWKKGMFHGQGIAKDTNGIMKGVFEKNLMISIKIDFVDGSSYEGTLEKDQFHGLENTIILVGLFTKVIGKTAIIICGKLFILMDLFLKVIMRMI